MTPAHEIPEAVIARIEKCLAMAESQVNEHEAANGLRAAQRIAEEYGLDLAGIAAAAQGKTKDKVEYKIDNTSVCEKKFRPYELCLAAVLGELFTVRTINCGGRRLHAIGTAQDNAIFGAAFNSLRKQIARKTRSIYGQRWTGTHGSYAMGFVAGVNQQLKVAKAKDAPASDGRALVLVNKEQQVDNAVAQYYPRLKAAKTSRISDGHAFYQGQAEGRTANLNFRNAIQC